MNSLKSGLASKIAEFLHFRQSIGLSNLQEDVFENFDAYCQKYHPESKNLCRDVVRGWATYEMSQGRGGMYNRISPLRLFAKYLGDGAYVLPTTAVPKKPKCTPYIMTDDEIRRFFNAVDNVEVIADPFMQEIAPVMFRLLYTCGLRPGECRLIKCSELNFTTGEILIKMSKSHKERIVVMSDDMLGLCKQYYARRAASVIKSEYLFPMSNGNPIANYQLHRMFTKCWRLANTDIPPNMLPRVRPYDLRHRFASTNLQMWIDEGRDLYAMLPYLRSYMGHDDFEMTAYYYDKQTIM